jgi:hypothetical protein
MGNDSHTLVDVAGASATLFQVFRALRKEKDP